MNYMRLNSVSQNNRNFGKNGVVRRSRHLFSVLSMEEEISCMMRCVLNCAVLVSR